MVRRGRRFESGHRSIVKLDNMEVAELARYKVEGLVD